MKNIVLFINLFSFSLIFGQVNYDFSIEPDAGNPYLFKVYATPDADATGADLASTGLNIFLSTGNTIGNVTTVTGVNWSVSETLSGSLLSGAGLDDGSRDLISLTTDDDQFVFNHSNGVRFEMVSFEVTSNPTSGSIELVSNSDSL